MSAGLLLDTCTILWLANDPGDLSETARRALISQSDRIFVSAISAFEIGHKHARGRLALSIPASDWFRAATRHHGIRIISISARIALAATQLPPHHTDPCDRFIVATAALKRLELVTPDALIRAYSEIKAIW